MKSLFLASILISSAHAIGFSDSSFHYQNQEEAQAAEFCYWGRVDLVCAEVQLGVQNRNMQYYSGAHDKIDYQSCEVIDDKVITSYTLSDDYGSEFKVTRTIDQCTRSSIVN